MAPTVPMRLLDNKKACFQDVELNQLLAPDGIGPIRQELLACLGCEGNMLLTGDTGTGKTLMAKAMASAMGSGPVVRATLGCSDDLNTITSELFGHERGAYSGAAGQRTGLVAHADGGVLILDEILNLSLRAQQLLLDFTQFGEYRPLGYDGPQALRARVRILAVTNGDIQEAISQGRFRKDLYYRLAAVHLQMPPLCDRRQDIPQLAKEILDRTCGPDTWQLTDAYLVRLCAASIDWPGNIRQLEGVLLRSRNRALSTAPMARRLEPGHIQPIDLGPLAPFQANEASAAPGLPLLSRFSIQNEDLGDTWTRLQGERDEHDRLERDILTRALKRHAGVVARVARELGLPRTTLTSRIQSLGLEAGSFRPSSVACQTDW